MIRIKLQKFYNLKRKVQFQVIMITKKLQKMNQFLIISNNYNNIKCKL